MRELFHSPAFLGGGRGTGSGHPGGAWKVGFGATPVPLQTPCPFHCAGCVHPSDRDLSGSLSGPRGTCGSGSLVPLGAGDRCINDSRRYCHQVPTVCRVFCSLPFGVRPHSPLETGAPRVPFVRQAQRHIQAVAEPG